jgi:hypothetical protein
MPKYGMCKNCEKPFDKNMPEYFLFENRDKAFDKLYEKCIELSGGHFTLVLDQAWDMFWQALGRITTLRFCSTDCILNYLHYLEDN